jgi:hypothetical protein
MSSEFELKLAEEQIAILKEALRLSEAKNERLRDILFGPRHLVMERRDALTGGDDE